MDVLCRQANREFRDRGRLSVYNRYDKFGTDSPYQTRCQRENNNYCNYRRCFGGGGTKQYANYAKNLPSISMTVANTLMSKIPLQIFSGSVNNKSCTVLRDTRCSAIGIDKRLLKEEDYIGNYECYKLFDGSVAKLETAKAHIIKDPFFTGRVKV
ncbi:hypothetical protein PoB_003432300 [Plakobranchus ocellatus]|uniref:Uncharacterized protein n=1 Tax=Plakobranchus ocellatus TaxID=259542 RepID=A0AAV4ALZ8_9GAST|nr:hypothetical protein PoB_003432300 [Plakobranchus ocellatus]